MESFDEISAFVRVVDARSFAGAAQSLGVTPSAMSKAISRLEERLGAKLLHRTTRSLNLTDAGQAFYQRCVDLIDRLAEAECEVACMLGRPAGRLRVGVPHGIARTLLAPALPRFLARYPDLHLQIVASDRIVDLVEEGLDVVLRVGELSDSSLHARRVGTLGILTVASPAFLALHGEPGAPSDMDPKHCLQLTNPNTGQVRPWTFTKGAVEQRIDPASNVSFTDIEAKMAAAVAGVGYARVSYFTAERELEAGRLRAVLPDWDGGTRPVSALYARDRKPLAKVRAFVDFAAELFHEKERKPLLTLVAQDDATRRATKVALGAHSAPKAL